MVTRILLVSPSFFPAVSVGGPTAFTRGLFDTLCKTPDVDVRVLTTDARIGEWRGPMSVGDQEDVTDFLNSPRIRYCRRSFGPDFSVQFVRHLPALVRWADVVQIHGVYCSTTILAMAAARVFGRPVVWSPHGSLQAYGAARRRLIKMVWNQALRLISWRSATVMRASSDAERSANQRVFPGFRHVTIPNAVRLPARLPRAKKLARRHLMFLGRLDPVKQLERLIGAMPMLPTDIALTVYGAGNHGYVESLKRLTITLGVEGRVIFKGWLQHSDKATAFAGADVLVLPSVSENFGQVVIEALAHGVPVVASEGTPWQSLETRECGRWVPARSERIAEACLDLLGRDRTALRRRARRWMREEFSNANIGSTFLGIYQDLVNPSRRGRLSHAKPGRSPKICIVTSCGGHLTEVRALAPAYRAQPHFYVLNDRVELVPDLRGRTQFIRHSERDLWTLWNILEMLVILWRERPDVILSTGAGPIVPAAIVGRYLFGCRIVYVESMTRVNAPSLTGRIMYRLAHRFFYQWHGPRDFFPKGEYGGPLI